MDFSGTTAVDKDGFLNLRREVEELDKEDAVLENAILPNGLVTIPDVDGHSDAKFAIRFRH
jgi:hypothetical protein